MIMTNLLYTIKMKTSALKEISFLIICLLIAVPTYAGERPIVSTHIPYTKTINIECSQIASFVGEFRELTKEGNAQAAFCLGLVYEEEGFKEDAIKWFRKSLELNSKRARTKLISIFQTIDRREVPTLYFDAALRDIKPYRYVLAKLTYKHWKEKQEERFLIFS